MILGQQIRMARAGLRWTIEDLSEESGVSPRTIKRLEGVDEVVSANISTIKKLIDCFECAGIEFIGTPDDGPGIRIRAPKMSG